MSTLLFPVFLEVVNWVLLFSFLPVVIKYILPIVGGRWPLAKKKGGNTDTVGRTGRAAAAKVLWRRPTTGRGGKWPLSISPDRNGGCARVKLVFLHCIWRGTSFAPAVKDASALNHAYARRQFAAGRMWLTHAAWARVSGSASGHTQGARRCHAKSTWSTTVECVVPSGLAAVQLICRQQPTTASPGIRYSEGGPPAGEGVTAPVRAFLPLLCFSV
jgi:hypothetical protein